MEAPCTILFNLVVNFVCDKSPQKLNLLFSAWQKPKVTKNKKLMIDVIHIIHQISLFKTFSHFLNFQQIKLSIAY